MASQIRGVDNFDSANAGKVLQVKRGVLATMASGTGDFDIMSVSITPLQSDSKMLINVYVQWSVMTNNIDDWGMQLYRDTSVILGETQNNYFISGGGIDSYDWVGQGSSVYGVNFASKQDFDESRTAGTSPITYKLKKKASSGTGKNVSFQRDGWGGASGESQRSDCVITVMEIAQ